MAIPDFQQCMRPIDGEKLAALMVEHNLGVATKKTYRMKAIDTDFIDDV